MTEERRCQRCGVVVPDEQPGASWASVSERILTLDEILAGVDAPATTVYAYCPEHNPYKGLHAKNPEGAT